MNIIPVARTLSAVYEVVGHRDAQDKLKAEELFRILDENSDGEFKQIATMKNFKIENMIQ